MRQAMYAAAAVLAFCAWPAAADANSKQTPTDVQPPVLRVHYVPCPDDGGPACAYMDAAATEPGRQLGDIYVGPHPVPRFQLKHETCHQVDAQLLTDGDRHWFARQLSLALPWVQGTGLEGLQSPHERFADACAACLLGWVPGGKRWEDAYGYEPTARQHRRICAALARVGRRAPVQP